MWLRNNQTTRQNVCDRRGFYGSIAWERGRWNGTEMLVDVDVEVSRFWFWVEDLIEDIPFSRVLVVVLVVQVHSRLWRRGEVVSGVEVGRQRKGRGSVMIGRSLAVSSRLLSSGLWRCNLGTPHIILTSAGAGWGAEQHKPRKPENPCLAENQGC
jgi:hypothetical protein